MNKAFMKLVSGLLQAVSVNIARLVISVLMTLLLPKFLGVEDFSRWQLYLFYLSYVVYSSLGWGEGMYLKYGGKTFGELDCREISGQLWAQGAYEAALTYLALIVLALAMPGAEKKLILQLAIISACLDILRFSLQSILQATNRIKEFSWVAGSERVLFFLFAVISLGVGLRDYRALIASEIAARVVTLVLAVILCRRLVLARLNSWKQILSRTRQIIGAGFILMIASVASQLILGVVRFAIEQKWGMVTFGKVSLTLSIANMVITCISAAGIVLFPLLRRVDSGRMVRIYDDIRIVITLSILVLLLMYAPIEKLLTLWLPQYRDSLKYFVILMPMGVYETRTYVLTDTYFKTFQHTEWMLFINIATCLLSLVLTALAVYIFENIDMAVFSILPLVIFRNTLAEILLKPYLGRPANWRSMLMEFGLIIIFVVSNWLMGAVASTVVYLAALLLYLLATRKQIRCTWSAFNKRAMNPAAAPE